MADPDPGRRYADCHEALAALRLISPPGTRPDLTTVEAADLLAGVPHSDSPPPVPAKRKRLRRVLAAVVAVVVLGAAGFLIWQPVDKTSPGQQTATSQQPDSAPVVAWTPSPIEPCSRVDIGRVRAGNQRCQRVSGTVQSWVAAPAEGFPAKSNPNGPLAGEKCDKADAADFDPAGVPMVCREGIWASSR